MATDEDYIVIPVSALPALGVTKENPYARNSTALPPRPEYYSISQLSPDEKARRYMQQALDNLALARYWNAKAEEPEDA